MSALLEITRKFGTYRGRGLGESFLGKSDHLGNERSIELGQFLLENAITIKVVTNADRAVVDFAVDIPLGTGMANRGRGGVDHSLGTSHRVFDVRNILEI